MSQYGEAEIAGVSVAELESALQELGLTCERSRRGAGTVMLDGCLESAGRPVHLRIEAGVLDTAEDFGFLTDGGQVRLVCGDVDQSLLTARLLAPIHAQIVEARIRVQGAACVETSISSDASGRDGAEVVIRVSED